MRIPAWLVAAAASACLGFGPSQALAARQSLTILHDNDLHGHLREFCYIETGKGPDEHCQVGGAARRATLIRRMRRHASAPVLVIDSGDTSTRGPLATEYEGLDEVAAMNAIGYDMAAIGNNEFKLKDAADVRDAAGAQAALARLVRQSRFPWLCANATDANGAPLPGARPYIVRRIGRLRVAFLGLTAPRSASYPQTKGLTIGDPVAAAKIWIPRARAHADIVIAVTHIGVDDDERLVRETRGIDAVVGGDSHTFLYQAREPKNLDGVAVPVVQDGEFGVRLGRFDLTFEGDARHGWRLAHWTDELISVDGSVRPDPTVLALVERYARRLDRPAGTVASVGQTPAERTRQTADILAGAWKSATGADVGLQPELSLFESFRNQAVTRYQIHAIVPFHDTLWTGQITGARLKALLATPTPVGGVMRATIAPADIDETRTYTAATTDFVGQALFGGGGTDTHDDAREALERVLSARPSPESWR